MTDSGNLMRTSQFAAQAHGDKVNATQRIGSAVASAPAQVYAAQRQQQELQERSLETQVRMAAQRLKQQQYAQDVNNAMKLFQIRGMAVDLKGRELALKEQQRLFDKSNEDNPSMPVRAGNPYEMMEDPVSGKIVALSKDASGRMRYLPVPEDRAAQFRTERKTKKDREEAESEGKRQYAEARRKLLEKELKSNKSGNNDLAIVKAFSDPFMDRSPEEEAIYQRALARLSGRSQDPQQESPVDASQFADDPILKHAAAIQDPEIQAMLRVLVEMRAKARPE